MFQKKILITKHETTTVKFKIISYFGLPEDVTKPRWVLWKKEAYCNRESYDYDYLISYDYHREPSQSMCYSVIAFDERGLDIIQ